MNSEYNLHLEVDIRKKLKGFSLDISFEAGRGCLGILGPSGCGKSALINMLAGYETPDAGSILIDGEKVSGPGPDRLVVFQETALFPWMTVFENVSYGPRVRGELSGKDLENTTMKLLEMVGLEDFRSKYPSQLSGGAGNSDSTGNFGNSGNSGGSGNAGSPGDSGSSGGSGGAPAPGPSPAPGPDVPEVDDPAGSDGDGAADGDGQEGPEEGEDVDASAPSKLQPSAQPGWQSSGGTWRYRQADGSYATGWLKDGSSWYYLDKTGKMATGWAKVGKSWYYLNRSGAMVTGWQKVGGSWYYLKGSGAMATGWYRVGSKWYYSNGSGAMQAGTWVGNYYVTSSGAMAVSTWVGKYHVNASGVWDKTR